MKMAPTKEDPTRFMRAAQLTIALVAAVFPCSGLLCPDLKEYDVSQAKELIRQRISKAPSITVVGFPSKDTSRVAFDSKVDTVCSKTLELFTYRAPSIHYKGKRKTRKTFVSVDTTTDSYSCPNPACIRDYICKVEISGSKWVTRDSMECKCDGKLSGGTRSETLGGGCSGSLYQLGKNIGGLVFEPVESLDLKHVSLYCPSDPINDRWLPIEKDSIEIRYLANEKIQIKRISLKEIIDG